MGKQQPVRYRVEIWEIMGSKYYAHIWEEEEWNRLPAPQRPRTAMLVHGIGWVDLQLIRDQPLTDDPN